MKNAEQERQRRNLLTVETVETMVDESLGRIDVLCIIGPTGSGKSWALNDWAKKNKTKVAYIDCQKVHLGEHAVMRYGPRTSDVEDDELMIKNTDAQVFVVDESQSKIDLVDKLFKQCNRAVNRLLILPLQDLDQLAKFQIPIDQRRCYSVAGLPFKEQEKAII